MKKILLPLLMLLCLCHADMMKAANTDVSDIDNVIYVEPFAVTKGTQVQMSFYMKNTAAIRGFQFNLKLPTGVTVAKSSKGKILASLAADRLPDEDEHTLSTAEQQDGSIMFLCASQYAETFTGTEGVIATVTLNISDNIKDGNYPIVLTYVKLSENDISKFYLTDYVESTVTVGNPQSKYTLTYMVDGATYKTYELAAGESITPEPAPTKEGFTFSGWSEIPATMPASDVTVTGTFSVNKYKLTYMVDGTTYKTVEVEYGASITPEPAPTKEGYTFSGWSGIPATMPASDVTVTGTFSVNKYKLTYMVDGATYKTVEVEYGAIITPEPAPTKEGYTFSGWSGIPATMPASDVTVTGTFSVNKYKLTYMVDDTTYKTVEVEYGATITPEPAPTKEGSTFSGWSEIPATMPAEDVTVSGSFTKDEQEITVDGITIKVDKNGVVTITDCTNASGDYTVPQTINYNGEQYMITNIGANAFKGNKALTRVTIPDIIKAIGQFAFEGCSNLNEIIFGKGITSIGSKAFANIWPSANTGRRAGSEGLKVSCYATSVPETALDAFDGTPVSEAVLLVDDALVNEYKTTAPWNQFGTILGFNEASGIDAVRSVEHKARIYTLDGKAQDTLQKGLNIVRMGDGTTKKVVLK